MVGFIFVGNFFRKDFVVGMEDEVRYISVLCLVVRFCNVLLLSEFFRIYVYFIYWILGFFWVIIVKLIFLVIVFLMRCFLMKLKLLMISIFILFMFFY